VVGLAGLDVADEGAEGFDGVGDVVVLLAGAGDAGVALGVGAYAERQCGEYGRGGRVAGTSARYCEVAWPDRVLGGR
jgi:hypothetical protein